MGSADDRKDRNNLTTPIARLGYDMRAGGYFERGVLAGKKAHTNEHIQADCILALLDLHKEVAKITEILARLVPDRTKTIDQGKDVMGQLADMAKRLERIEGRVKAFITEQ